MFVHVDAVEVYVSFIDSQPIHSAYAGIGILVEIPAVSRIINACLQRQHVRNVPAISMSLLDLIFIESSTQRCVGRVEYWR